MMQIPPELRAYIEGQMREGMELGMAARMSRMFFLKPDQVESVAADVTAHAVAVLMPYLLAYIEEHPQVLDEGFPPGEPT